MNKIKLDINNCVDRFLSWQLPTSVCSDLCATIHNYRFPRSGTNLLNAQEAKMMLEHVLQCGDTTKHNQVNPSIMRMDCRIDTDVETKLVFIEPPSNFAGTVGVHFESKRSACIVQLYVKPGSRLRGIGKQLVDEACRISKEDGCETLGLVLKKDNEDASIFYSKLGFIHAYQYEDGDFLMVKVL